MSINIERAILSAIIFEPALIETAKVKAEHFSLPFHQNLFKAFHSLNRDGKPIDEEFIRLELEKKKVFDELAMIDVLSANPIANIEPYISTLIEEHNKRNISVQVRKILSTDGSSDEILARLEELKTNIDTNTVSALPPVHNTANIVAEEPTFFLKDYLPIQKNEINMISGKGGGGKSFVSLIIASMLAKRHNLKVFAYLSEDNIANTKNRLEVVYRSNPLIKDTNFDIWGKSERPLPFLSKGKEGFKPSEFFYQFTKHFDDYDIIILDPLIAFIAEDENNNAEARLLFNLLNEWCEKKSKTIILIHHHNKDNKMRGASAFVDAVRMHYIIKTDEEDSSVRILELEKNNHLPSAKNYRIKLFGSPTSGDSVEVVYEDNTSSTIGIEALSSIGGIDDDF